MDYKTLIVLTIFIYLVEHHVTKVAGRRRNKVEYKPQVERPNGILRGKFGSSRGKREFYKFLGIPYAEPPISERRFEPPVPALGWSGIRHVDKYRPPCLQLNLISIRLTGQEDCLYANVFVPKTDSGPNRAKGEDDDDKDKNGQDDDEDDDPVRSRGHREKRGHHHRDREVRRHRHERRREDDVIIPFNILEGIPKRLPVMVYIYGGYFMYGSARLYGPQYFMDEDVILVTFNYRVGALGFLNTGDGIIKGNMGLKDQNLLLRWVKDNVQYFGGDPERITVFGESAGASSVHLHILSKASTGLFQKAIAQSGSAIRTWTIVEKPREQAQRLGAQLNCTDLSSPQLVKCLKKVDGMQIVATHYERLDILSNPLGQFGPTVETTLDSQTFLSQPPIQILNSGHFNHVPLMIGVTKDEGLIYSARIVQNNAVSTKINTDWANTAPILLNYNASTSPNGLNVAEKVREFYLSHSQSQSPKKYLNFLADFKDFTNMFTDRLYVAATRITVREHSKYAPVYAYIYSYQGDFSFYNIFVNNGDSGNGPRVQQLTYSLLSSWVSRNVFGSTPAKLGVCHLDDVIMLFKLRVLSNIRRREPDYPMSRAMVKSWVQFASENQKLQFGNQNWLPINSRDEQPMYMNLNAVNGGMIVEPFTNRAKFWESINLIN